MNKNENMENLNNKKDAPTTNLKTEEPNKDKSSHKKMENLSDKNDVSTTNTKTEKPNKVNSSNGKMENLNNRKDTQTTNPQTETKTEEPGENKYSPDCLVENCDKPPVNEEEKKLKTCVSFDHNENTSNESQKTEQVNKKDCKQQDTHRRVNGVCDNGNNCEQCVEEDLAHSKIPTEVDEKTQTTPDNKKNKDVVKRHIENDSEENVVSCESDEECNCDDIIDMLKCRKGHPHCT